MAAVATTITRRAARRRSGPSRSHRYARQVINIYPNLDRLAGLSADRTRRLYGLVYPRDTRIVRLVFFAMSLILRLPREPARGIVHPADAIERVVRENGLSPPSLEESDACGRLIIASLCTPPAR